MTVKGKTNTSKMRTCFGSWGSCCCCNAVMTSCPEHNKYFHWICKCIELWWQPELYESSKRKFPIKPASQREWQKHWLHDCLPTSCCCGWCCSWCWFESRALVYCYLLLSVWSNPLTPECFVGFGSIYVNIDGSSSCCRPSGWILFSKHGALLTSASLLIWARMTSLGWARYRKWR